jgi:ubiquinone/menaquinone biosynthesis C-methylase UbiE
MTTPDYSAHINRHYASSGLEEAILDGLRKAGKDPEHLSPDDLAPFDQFHSRGKAATVDLARLADLKPGLRMLDVGGGLGGAARTLAAEFGCRVMVLDVTEEYCRVGEMLTRRTGQSERVSFRCASALDVPFADESFDVVWTQHSNMNIDAKDRLYAEAHRVLCAEGRLAIHEIVAGQNQPVHFPVPWATQPDVSFLRTIGDMRAIIENAGFGELIFHDRTQATLDGFRDRAAAIPGKELPALGLHLLLGKNFRPALANQLRNIEENRVAIIEAVYRKK